MAEIKETLELVDALQKLVDEVKKDSANGKLSVLELLGNYPEVMAIIEEGKDYKLIVDELKDLDADELIELNGKLIKIVFTILDIVKNLK